MHLRQTAVVLIAVMALAGACSDDEDDPGAVAVDEPIGAPEPDYSDPGPQPPSGDVAKSASIEMDVPRDELGSAAQQIIDLATSPRIGGFLVSSIVDTEGHGTGSVLVKVPSARFEDAVGELERIGNVTRQQLDGEDLSPGAEAARARATWARQRIDAVRRRIGKRKDPQLRARARAELVDLHQELAEARRGAESVDAETAHAPIDVSLEGSPPPPPPERSTFEQALDTAASVSTGIASGAVLAAAVVLPVGVLALVLLLAGSRIVRAVKPRLWG